MPLAWLPSLVLLVALCGSASAADDAVPSAEPAHPTLIALEQPPAQMPDLGDTVVETRVRFAVLAAASPAAPPADPSPVLVWVEKPSCGCISAVPNREQYLPGEGGCIDVQFVIGQHEGLQHVLLTVHAAHPGAMTQQQIKHLDLCIQVPSIVTIAPRALSWSANEGDAIKTMTFAAVHPGTVLTTWDGIDPAFALVPDHCVQTPNKVILAFRRVAPDRAVACSIHMHADVGGGQLRERIGFLVSNLVAPAQQR